MNFCVTWGLLENFRGSGFLFRLCGFHWGNSGFLSLIYVFGFFVGFLGRGFWMSFFLEGCWEFEFAGTIVEFQE